MSDINDITKDNFATDVLGATGLQFVYYYAPWCKPCLEMDPIIEAILPEVSKKITVVRVNTDRESEIVRQQKIRVLPSYQIFKAGKNIDTLRGKLSKLELMGELSRVIAENEAQKSPASKSPKKSTKPE